MISCVRRNSNPANAAPGSRKIHVLARIHLVVEHERLEGIRFDHFLDELHIDWVFAKNSVPDFRFEIDRDEESPRHLWVDPFSALDAEHFWNFQKLHPGVHHHFLEIGGSDGWLQFIENNVMDHELLVFRGCDGSVQAGNGVSRTTKRREEFALDQPENLPLPVERAFLERVDVADHQDRDKAQHAPENHFTVHNHLAINYRPGIHEDDLEVEENE